MNPVGFNAHSRWLSEATPPVVSHIFGSILAGMPAATLAGILASLPGCSSVLWSIPVVSDLRPSTTGYALRPLSGSSRCMTIIDRQATTRPSTRKCQACQLPLFRIFRLRLPDKSWPMQPASVPTLAASPTATQSPAHGLRKAREMTGSGEHTVAQNPRGFDRCTPVSA